MTKRNNFTKTQMRDMRSRSGDVCEAGRNDTEKFYGMQPGECCTAKATAFDHITADALKRTKIKGIDEGNHVCGPHHKHKTHTHDIPKINKAKRIDEKAAGIPRKANKQPIPQRPKPAPVIAAAGTSKGEAAHRAAMAAKGKRIVPRRLI